MKLKLVLLALSCLLASCARSDNSKAGGDPTGTWVGDFGPAFYDRNTISLELHWDGKELTGMIRPGVQGKSMYRNFEGFQIEHGTFDPATGEMKFDAMYKPRNRRYVIEGTLKKDTLAGKWNRPEENRNGDFKLNRSR